MSDQGVEKYIRKESFLIVIDSRNVTTKFNGTMNSDVCFCLHVPIQIPRDCIYMTWVVSHFTCPVSFYQINTTNNCLTVVVGTNTNSYYFTPGNYNAQTFMTQFTATMPAGFTIAYNSNTNKFTIGYTTSFTINQCSILPIIGGALDGATTYPSTSNSVSMPFPCNFAGLNSFNIRCSSIRTSNLDSYDCCSSSDIIASVPVSAIPGDVIYYEKKNDFEFEVKESTVDLLRLKIQDDLNNFIDFNNQSWNLVIQCNYIREFEKDMQLTFHGIYDGFAQNGI
jgi:hypothetical protein